MIYQSPPSILEWIIFPFLILKHIIISILLFIKQYTFPWYKDIARKTVLLTGGSNGLGRILSLRLADETCNLIIVDIDENNLIETANLIQKQTGQIIRMFLCDIRSHKAIKKLREKIHNEVGPVDIVINNAGICNSETICRMTDEDYHEVFDVNTHSCFYIIKEFLPDMIKRNSGHFVFVSSITYSISGAKLAAYCASKAATMSICETLWLELNHVYKLDGVKVTGITPYQIQTNTMFKNCKSRIESLFPLLDPKYVAEKIVLGIKKNQFHLAIGRLLYFIVFLKSIIPSNALLELYKFSGGISIMDNYHDDLIHIRRQNYKSLDFDDIKEVYINLPDEY